MDTQELKTYMQGRMAELDKNLDEQEFWLRGRFNFGMNKQQYQHLPSWNAFVKDKKRLVRLIWAEAFLTVGMVYAFVPGGWELYQSKWKTLLVILAVILFLGLFLALTSYFITAFEVNRVQKQVKRLIYEDLLHQIEQEEKETVQ